MTPESITIEELVVGDDPAAWAGAGFTVDEGVTVLGSVRIRLAGTERRGLRSWSLRSFLGDAGHAIDGLETRSGSGPVPEPAVHENGTLLIDHVVVATPDSARTTTAFERAGLACRRTRDTEMGGAAMRQTFFRAGEVIIEVVGPPEATDTGPARFFGLALTVADLDETATALGERLGRAKAAVQPGRRIATLRHRDLDLSVPIAFMSAPPASP